MKIEIGLEGGMLTLVLNADRNGEYFEVSLQEYGGARSDVEAHTPDTLRQLAYAFIAASRALEDMKKSVSS